ncbi:MAG: zinc ribbon domain-containing protein [Oscillospiraceae bacterium]|nr:zinc ribbon domain-containing protein [Oscillospiraceae bacterium]
MFDNIGAKIKVLAQAIAGVGIGGAVLISTVVFLHTAMSQGAVSPALAVGILIFGILTSCISSWLVYGFGELIEKTTEIAKNTSFADSGQEKSFEITCKCGAKNTSPPDSVGNGTRCPKCQKLIKDTANVCPYCQIKLSAISPSK